MADADGKLARLYDVKTPVVNFAKRVTFVIDAQQKIKAILKGSDALDPAKALAHCAG